MNIIFLIAFQLILWYLKKFEIINNPTANYIIDTLRFFYPIFLMVCLITTNLDTKVAIFLILVSFGDQFMEKVSDIGLPAMGLGMLCFFVAYILISIGNLKQINLPTLIIAIASTLAVLLIVLKLFEVDKFMLIAFSFYSIVLVLLYYSFLTTGNYSYLLLYLADIALAINLLKSNNLLMFFSNCMYYSGIGLYCLLL